MPGCFTAQTRVNERYPVVGKSGSAAAYVRPGACALRVFRKSAARGIDRGRRIVCVAIGAITRPSAAGNADGPRGRASTRRPPSRASPSAGRTTSR
jgi:hypothetical protein